MDSNRDLIFGLLGLQNGLIDSGMLVAAFHAWTLDRKRTLQTEAHQKPIRDLELAAISSVFGWVSSESEYQPATAHHQATRLDTA